MLALCALALGPAATSAADPRLEEVDALAEAGAPSLALWLIDRHQPASADDSEAWADWERRRVRILQRHERWRELLDRLERFPPRAPAGWQDWALERRAQAHVALGEGRAALADLRRLVWAGPPPSADRLERLRRLIIRAYLAAGAVADARVAMRGYEQDYRPDDAQWRLLRAETLLRSGDALGASRLLASDASEQALALRLLAELETGDRSPDSVWDQARSAAREGERDPRLQRRLWWVAAHAAHRADAPEKRIRALSRALVVPVSGSDALFPVSAGQLWEAYVAYGRELGNRLRLLLGDDEAWFDAAMDRLGTHELQGRALLAALTQVDRAGSRSLAHEKFSQSLSDTEMGRELLLQLYIDGGRYADIDDLPEDVRQRLADFVLGRSDIGLASRLMAGLSEPPQGTRNEWFWQLRRARVLIMGGEVDEGIEALGRLVGESEPLGAERSDRLMQVLFDLQNLGRHEAAVRLFQRLPMAEDAPSYTKRRREVYYWIADSYKAMGRYTDAARYYLRSATFGQAEAMDPWGQTARYQAADALAEAGMRDDARRLYQQLLQVTKDANRRAMLRNKLQQLWLVPKKGASEPPPEAIGVDAG